MKVGVIIPTCNRPDFLRKAVLQWIVQTRKPDMLAIHQNGDGESYEWVIEDLKPLIPIKYIHVPAKLPQHFWYYIPLQYLFSQDFDVYLWGDHDDIYYTNHVATVLDDLKEHDFTISDTCGLLCVGKKGFRRYETLTQGEWRPNALGAISSSMAFNKRFAEMFLRDMLVDRTWAFTDNLVSKVTAPKAKVNITRNMTTTYVAHAGTVSTFNWTEDLE